MNTQDFRNPDRDRINIKEYYEVEYWTKALDVHAEYLRKAVASVGTSAVEVRKFLKK